jgi:hypothetical protein
MIAVGRIAADILAFKVLVLHPIGCEAVLGSHHASISWPLVL